MYNVFKSKYLAASNTFFYQSTSHMGVFVSAQRKEEVAGIRAKFPTKAPVSSKPVYFTPIYFTRFGKEDMCMRDDLRLSGKGTAVFPENLIRSMYRGSGCNNV